MMRRFLANPMMLLVASIAVSAAACSKGSTTSPVAPSTPTPSATSTPAPSLVGGATITGMIVTGTPSGTTTLLDVPMLAGAGRVTVSVTGTSISVTSDDDGHFTLLNVPPGNLTLTITGSGFSAQVALPPVNTNDQLRVTVRVNGSTATLDDDELESSDNKVEVEGQIASVAGMTSSGGTIVVGRLNTSVIVPSTASISKGGTALKPNDLVVGMRVHVRAAKAGSTLTATTVIVQTRNPGDNTNKSDDHDDQVEDTNEANYAGTIVGSPTGSCSSSLAVRVGSTRVVTNSSTKFDNVTCAALAAGDTVSGEGTKQTDGSVLAKEVEKVGGSKK